MSSSSGGYTVYELINARLKEIYVGLKPDGFHDTPEHLLRTRPSLAHWKLEDAGSLSAVTSGVTRSIAVEFLHQYVRTGVPKGWRFIWEE